MARTFDDDWLAFPHAVGVLEELKTVMAEARLPGPCTASVMPGDQIAHDYIGDECESFAYSRVAGVYPSTTAFPDPDARPRDGLWFGVTVELGLVRRFVTPDNGEAPTVEDQYDATRLQMADMRAMLEALCRYAGDRKIVIGQYLPYGPAGQILGGSWTATLQATSAGATD